MISLRLEPVDCHQQRQRWCYKWPPTCCLLAPPSLCSYPLSKGHEGMAIVSNREALKTLAVFSINEEFCQKFGGKIFGYSGEPTPAYQQLCGNFSLLIDHMASSLHAIKDQIPSFSGDGGMGNGWVAG